ncbi:hypothetical protein Tco_0627541 [Tanacetum coccineum]|uniref:Uncharacterized protein n=1 Tax=Tanacetum coccineum TaxID=301880 RepID=A0ABQ4WMR9_9ASTR
MREDGSSRRAGGLRIGRRAGGLRTGGQGLVVEGVWVVDGIGHVDEGHGDGGSGMDEYDFIAGNVKTPIAAVVRRITKKNARGGVGLQFVINVYIQITKTPEDTNIMISGLFMVEFGKRYFIVNGLGRFMRCQQRAMSHIGDRYRLAIANKYRWMHALITKEYADAPPPPPPPPSQTPSQQTPHTVSTIKLPILKKGEYDIWAMKMEHYLAHTDYPIWEVIQRGNGPVSVSTDTNGLIKVLPPKTAEETLARERERKARTTLLMALPEDHLAKFHKMTDAKEMWEAIKSRFGGNDESKKMQKYILKQQFEGFSVSNSEGLHKGYDRFQSLLSQLEIHGAGVSTEDANQKFLRSLPSAWSQVSLIMRTKPGVDSLSFDDLYNNLRVFESDVKGSTASSSSTQNVAFVSENTSSTNDVSTAYGVSNSSGHNSQYEHTSSYSLLANQSSCPQLDHEDLEQLDEFDLEEMDLKWQVAMISMRMKKFYKKTGRKLQFDAKEPVGTQAKSVEVLPEQSWFNELVDANKRPEEHQLQIGSTVMFRKCMKKFLNKDKITKVDLEGLAFELSKKRFRNSMELEYNLKQSDKIHKFSDGTLNKVYNKLDVMLRDNRLGFGNEGMTDLKWTSKDIDREKSILEKIEKKLKERRRFRRLESFVGGRKIETDYRLLVRLE